jgi:ABC-type bacteriocin/lantibiotic exporter with double-glycine peptidase domain
MWGGSIQLKLASVSLLILLLISQFFGVIYPLIFKAIIDNISEEPDYTKVYFLILQYAGLKFTADTLSNIKQWPFAYISAQAELVVSKLIYSHIQEQSLEFHLSRETGKILRAVQRGSGSFVTILNVVVF